MQHKSAPILSPTDLRANKYRNITVIFRLSYKILKLAQEGCRDNQVSQLLASFVHLGASELASWLGTYTGFSFSVEPELNSG